MNNKMTRKEHWLPETSHIAQFSNKKGVVQVYRFTQKSKIDFIKTAKIFTPSPNGIGFEKDLYERPDLPQNTVEKNLAIIEGEFGKILEKKIKKHKPITQKERIIIAQYIELLQHRTPAQRSHITESLDELIKMVQQVAVANGHPEASDKMTTEIEEYKDLALTDTMEIAQEVNNWKYLDFCFLVIPDNITKTEFITGDHPVSLTDFTKSGMNNPYGAHPLNKTAENVVPLTPNIALFGNNVGITGYRDVYYNYIREVNMRTLSHSRQMVISREPISEHECKAMVERFPQSLILEYVELPESRAAKQ
ncbi:MAG: DUF4238 domain-containing protein [Candidatus Saccharimonadales bacterium]